MDARIFFGFVSQHQNQVLLPRQSLRPSRQPIQPHNPRRRPALVQPLNRRRFPRVSLLLRPRRRLPGCRPPNRLVSLQTSRPPCRHIQRANQVTNHLRSHPPSRAISRRCFHQDSLPISLRVFRQCNLLHDHLGNRAGNPLDVLLLSHPAYHR